MSKPFHKLILASHNAGKVREINELLAPLQITVVSAGELGLPEPDETGDTFEANAELKARAAADASGIPALADDSGLAVPALDGAPGIYSARWAGPSKDFSAAMARIRDELAARNVDINGTPAYFVCVLSLAEPNGAIHSFRGEIQGTLVYPPRGDKGFGYDPIFIPQGGTETFGEMDAQAKHAISHRAVAFNKFTSFLASVD